MLDDDSSVREHASAIASLSLAQQLRQTLTKLKRSVFLRENQLIQKSQGSLPVSTFEYTISRRGADMIVATESAIEKIVTAIGDVSARFFISVVFG